MSTMGDPERPRRVRRPRTLRALLRASGRLTSLPASLVRAAARLTSLPGELLRRARQGSARQAPSWWLAAREASDVRSLRDALERLLSAPAELVVGPEPPPLPPGGGRLGWLHPYRTAILWLATATMFWLTSQMLYDLGRALPVAMVLAALISLPLGLAATRPLLAWRLLVVVAVVTALLMPQKQGPPWQVPLVFVALYVVYVVCARLELHLVVGIWLVTNATVVWSYAVPGARRDAVGEVYFTIVLVTAVVAFGYLSGTRRRLEQEVVEGRQRRQAEHARSALLEERARIARELHDIVAHHMSVIAVRTETAPFRIPELPQAARDDLAETSAIAREALTEMRRLLGVLRGADDGAEHAPQPGMEQLGTLVAAVRGAGLAVDLQVVGAERPLPSGVELSAYRIVQEALSNTLRHAPGASATVQVGYERDRLRLRVRNDAPSVRRDRPRPWQPGQGIIGMRERAAMLGGHLAAGATLQGGYLVEAVLPLDGHPDEAEPT